jgi:hypothetical protein
MLGNGPRTGTFLATLIADFRDLAATDSVNPTPHPTPDRPNRPRSRT